MRQVQKIINSATQRFVFDYYYNFNTAVLKLLQTFLFNTIETLQNYAYGCDRSDLN